MWTPIAKAPNLMIAEIWKELFDMEGVTAMIVPDTANWVGAGEGTPRLILVPKSKKHVADEVVRKLG